MKRIEEQGDHGALMWGGHDDRARADFAFTLRNHVTGRLMPANRLVFDARASAAFAAAHGRAPQGPADIRAAMDADPWHRFYLSARRTSQELIWAAVTGPADGAVAPASGAAPTAAGGELTLDPSVAPPAYAAAIDIHCMPGGYLQDRGDGDMGAGAVYDRGVYLYMSGLMGALNNSVAQLGALWLRTRMPDFAPARILDLGCAVGHSTLPWAERFPDADVTGVDAGAALLRYAHARAGSLGVRAHFVQADAEAAPFPDASFDLVTSTILLHETSTRALPAILAECRRLLRPGGVMLHIDQPRFDDDDPWATFMQEQETHYNNEPFWRAYRRLDLGAVARDAGWAADELALDTLAADVIRQNQNNAEADPKAARKGFLAMLGVKRG
jgi:SAM-dependent methyltransferase